MAQRLERLPAMQETWVRSLGGEDPLEKEMDACLGKTLLLPVREKKVYNHWGAHLGNSSKRPRGRGENFSPPDTAEKQRQEQLETGGSLPGFTR